MKKLPLLYLLISWIILLNGCQKETSFENGTGPSVGTLQDDGAGECLPKTVAGAYIVGTVLDPTTNYIDVTVDVTTAGGYTIYTDTINGYHFRSTGTFNSTGLNTVRLKGKGTPVTDGIDNFVVTYGNSGCAVAVTVSASLAVFTLDGSPNGCTSAAPAGTYTAGIALTAANTVNLNINVTTVGSYTISTSTANGMTFTGSGVLTITGSQSIVLTGSGTPSTAAVTDIPVAAGTSSCTFPVTVQAAASAAVFTTNCASATVNGTYTVGAALVSTTHTITIPVDVTTPGTYNITGNAGGMTFSASGTFSAAGPTTVTLAGSGTPTTPGANTVALTGVASPCNIGITVNPAAGGNAVCSVVCASGVVNGTYTVGTVLAAANTIVVNVTVTTPGAYNLTGTVGGMTFTASGSFPNNGTFPVTLNGTGTPITAGANSLPISGGTGVCNVTINVTAAPVPDYFPRTTNSNWSYEFDDDAMDSMFMKVIAPTHSALGNTYNIFMGDDGTGLDSAGYFRKSGNDYYRYTNLFDYLSMDNDQRVEFIFLKDNLPAGQSWTSASFNNVFFGTPVTVRIKFTIMQKDVPYTINSSLGSVTYQNVIIVKESYELDAGGGNWVPLDDLYGYYIDYYARDKGWILDEWYDGVDPQPQGKMEARRLVVY